MKTLLIDLDDTLVPCGIYYQAAKVDAATLIQEYQKKEFLQVLSFEKIIRQIDEFDTQSAESVLGFTKHRFPNTLYEVALLQTGDMNTAISAREIGYGVFDQDYPLFPDVVHTLTELRQKYTLHLVTKGDAEIQMHKIKKNNLDRLIHCVSIVDKKTPHTYLDILSTYGYSVSETAMIGDSIRDDILHAQEAGLLTIHVNTPKPKWGYENVQGEPHYQIEKISDLLRIYERIL